MAAPSTNSTSKLQRKIFKKIARIRERLRSNENIIFSEQPSKILCVQNGGLENGVSQNDLFGIFSQFGCVQDIIMLPKKSYSFVCFDTITSAARAQEELTGFQLREGKDPSQNIRLYLFFVSQAQSSICPSTELPPGLIVVEDFVTEEFEQMLLQTVLFDNATSNDSGILKHRQVKHFGFEFRYGINNVDPNNPLAEGIPEICNGFLQKAISMNYVSHFPDQLTVNHYLPGQGIPPHIDTASAFEDGIMSLSCGSQVLMEFRHPDGRHLSVVLPQRSLLVMTGDSRYIWSHGITPRKSDIIPSVTGGFTLLPRKTRISFTFRKLAPTAGIVRNKLINSARAGLSYKPITDKEATVLESEHVHKVYEEIADHFSDTRHKPWPQIVQFIQNQDPGSLMVDIGCGNGKYFGINKHLYEIGSDRSENLASICQGRGFQVFVGDILAVPFRSCVADVVLCIAVIHHLSTESRRKKAVEELLRILQPGGQALIYVWAQEQELDRKKSKYLKAYRKDKELKLSDSNISKQDSGSSLCMQNFPLCKSEVPENQIPIQGSSNACITTPIDVKFSNILEQSSSSGKKMQQRGTVDSSLISKDDYKSNCGIDSTDICQSNVNTKTNKLQTKHEIAENCTGVVYFDAARQNSEEQCASSDNSKCQEQNGLTELVSDSSCQNLPVHVNRTEFKQQDMLVPWQLKKPRPKTDEKRQQTKMLEENKVSTFHRYYHVFQHGELDALCTNIPGCEIKKSYYDQGNWCVILQKCK